MNRQISQLITALVLLATITFVGCDLGTYNKRFKERNKPAVKKTSADEEADTDSEEDSGDSE